jgi:hypothetical protein
MLKRFKAGWTEWMYEVDVHNFIDLRNPIYQLYYQLLNPTYKISLAVAHAVTSPTIKLFLFWACPAVVSALQAPTPLRAGLSLQALGGVVGRVGVVLSPTKAARLSTLSLTHKQPCT